MSKKHFEAVAFTLSQIEDYNTREAQIKLWIEIFSKENPRFNIALFRNAIVKQATK